MRWARRGEVQHSAAKLEGRGLSAAQRAEQACATLQGRMGSGAVRSGAAVRFAMRCASHCDAIVLCGVLRCREVVANESFWAEGH